MRTRPQRLLIRNQRDATHHENYKHQLERSFDLHQRQQTKHPRSGNQQTQSHRRAQ